MIFLTCFCEVDGYVVLIVHLFFDVQIHFPSNFRFQMNLVVKCGNSLSSTIVVLPKIYQFVFFIQTFDGDLIVYQVYSGVVKDLLDPPLLVHQRQFLMVGCVRIFLSRNS